MMTSSSARTIDELAHEVARILILPRHCNSTRSRVEPLRLDRRDCPGSPEKCLSSFRPGEMQDPNAVSDKKGEAGKERSRQA